MQTKANKKQKKNFANSTKKVDKSEVLKKQNKKNKKVDNNAQLIIKFDKKNLTDYSYTFQSNDIA